MVASLEAGSQNGNVGENGLILEGRDNHVYDLYSCWDEFWFNLANVNPQCVKRSHFNKIISKEPFQ